jgi:hypothetical protein
MRPISSRIFSRSVSVRSLIFFEYGDADLFADLLRGRAADAVDGREADLGVLVRRDVDASDACHACPLT